MIRVADMDVCVMSVSANQQFMAVKIRIGASPSVTRTRACPVRDWLKRKIVNTPLCQQIFSPSHMIFMEDYHYLGGAE